MKEYSAYDHQEKNHIVQPIKSSMLACFLDFMLHCIRDLFIIVIVDDIKDQEDSSECNKPDMPDA